MKSLETDERLSVVLADWRVSAPREPSFRAAVWQRISAAQRAASWGSYARAHTLTLTSALAVALVIGGWVGREQARSRVAADRAEIARFYVQALDARVMPTP